MPRFFQRRVRVLLFTAAAAHAVWKYGGTSPQSQAADQFAFRTVSEAFANPPFFISGDGSHERPWELRTLSSGDPKPKGPPPTIVSLGDDPDGVFQASPLSPIDYAVILRNFDRLGVKHVALGTLMSWEEPDPIAYAALENRLSSLKSQHTVSVVTTTPLARSTTTEAMPAAFIRASIPIERVKGDLSLMPTVNRLPVPDTMLGSLNTLAGFSILESEPPAEGQPMLARWGDRVVFAFPLVAVLAERGLTPDGMEVRLGSHLKLGPQGPVIPIDEGGHLMGVRLKTGGEPVKAESLIQAESFAHDGSVILRDDRSMKDARDRQYSNGIASTVAFIQAEGGLTPPRVFKRLGDRTEAIYLGSLAALLVILASPSNFRLRILFGSLAGVVLIAQFVGTAFFSTWLPGVSSLCVILVGLIVAWPFNRKVSPPVTDSPAEPVAADKTATEPARIVSPEPESSPAPALEPAPPKPSEKAQPKPIPAKKAAKKAAKKQPRKKK